MEESGDRQGGREGVRDKWNGGEREMNEGVRGNVWRVRVWGRAVTAANLRKVVQDRESSLKVEQLSIHL